MDWLESSVRDASEKGRKVIIMSHIPPGEPISKHQQQTNQNKPGSIWYSCSSALLVRYLWHCVCVFRPRCLSGHYHRPSTKLSQAMLVQIIHRTICSNCEQLCLHNHCTDFWPFAQGLTDELLIFCFCDCLIVVTLFWINRCSPLVILYYQDDFKLVAPPRSGFQSSDTAVPNVTTALMVVPGVSPIYGNNAGFRMSLICAWLSLQDL